MDRMAPQGSPPAYEACLRRLVGCALVRGNTAIFRSAWRRMLTGALSPLFEQQVLQHHGIVMRLVMCGVYEGDPAMLRERTQPLELGGMLADL